MTVGRGRCLAVGVYLAIAALVAGGLAWTTRAALQLEHADTVRLALWRLDSRIFPVLAREDSRPVLQYEPLFPPVPAVYPTGKSVPLGQVLLPSPLLSVELPDWLALHFVVDVRFGWRSPQVPDPALAAKLRTIGDGLATTNATAQRAGYLHELAAQFPLTEWFGQPDDNDAVVQQKDQQQAGQIAANPSWNSNFPSQQGEQVLSNEAFKRNQTRSAITNEGKGMENANRGFDAYCDPIIFRELASGKAFKCSRATVDDMRPQWRRGHDGVDRLLFVRNVDVDNLFFRQGVLIDWDKLRTMLLNDVRDLLPNADLEPADESTQGDQMTALPIRLDAGPAPMALFPINDSPLRLGLVFAWIAAALALGMVALSGWSLMDLSERRFRFVSAVTHELRTPLTTLRLYLDMLTGGLVREEKQRQEYLTTLHGEADRLHRLIANVLDFARLERQQPNVNVQAVRVREMLDNLRVEWEGACKSAGKMISVDVTTSVPDVITTDPDLCRQLLGNLIDNACKYSRDASDPRVKVQASTEDGRVVFSVEDRGPGVPLREGRSVFRPFRRGSTTPANAGGVGLGLALADRWAKLLGGELRLTNANPGARFQFLCPLSS